MLDPVYLFIDGAYLRKVFADLFIPLFGDRYSLDFHIIKTEFQAVRVFYYDCLEDIPRPSESKTDFDARVAKQQAEFDGIDGVEGVHVRYGYLSPGRRRQQKEIDVSLAVDMLTHSFAKNLGHAVLLAGDRDFKPAVESLVRLGTYVSLAYEPRSGSADLARAADGEAAIDLESLCRWVKLDQYEKREDHFPTVLNYVNQDQPPYSGPEQDRLHLRRSGLIGSKNFSIQRRIIDGMQHVSVQVSRRDYKLYVFADGNKLFPYLETIYGKANWLP
jgi:uncharacterized LabA/DUF88 family protein